MLGFKLFGSGLTTLAVASICQDVTSGIVAAGTTQGTATALTSTLNGLGTVAAGSGVVLYAGSPGDCQIVYNAGLNPVNVYPPSGYGINQLAANIPHVLPINTACEYWFLSATQLIGVLSA
jgi:hypothetical protein